jgi:hypothetical protein
MHDSADLLARSTCSMGLLVAFFSALNAALSGDQPAAQ